MGKMDYYFENISKEVKKCYSVAEEARSKGYDPSDKVEILIAENMFERVVKLISTKAPVIAEAQDKIVERIKELEDHYGALDWRVALTVSGEIAQEKFCKFEDEREAMEVAIRVGFAYITLGVVASPLEGFVKLELKKRKDDGREFFSLRFSGPVRSAGGTGASVSILIADYIRKIRGYAEYDPTKEEIERFITEITDFQERVTNLQYFPSEEELRFLVEHLPVQIDGDPSEKIEVSNYKDLDRVGTNRIRSGICLVLAEALCQKAPKLVKQLDKWGEEFGNLDQWSFLRKFVKIQKKNKAGKGNDSKEESKLSPDYTFIKDLVAGRPILTHPLRVGGFRLRYGRCRNSGFSSDALSPASMRILDDFIGIGTQLRTERPGKSTIIASCGNLEGPIVKMKDGSVLFLNTEEEVLEKRKEVSEILFIGDMLINYGDFLDRNHKLVPCGYNEEWYSRELEKNGIEIDVKGLSFDDSLKFCLNNGVPMHPYFTFHWGDIFLEQLRILLEWIAKSSIKEDKIVLPMSNNFDEKDAKNPKRILELLGVPHRVASKEYAVIEGDFFKSFIVSLGLKDKKIEEVLNFLDSFSGSFEDEKTKVLSFLKENSGIIIRDKSGTFIGARMGRPEKAKMRKLDGSPQVLFPVGNEGGRLRSFQSVLEKGYVNSDFSLFYCPSCGKESCFSRCIFCGTKTQKRYYCVSCKKIMDEDTCKLHGKNREYNRVKADVSEIYDAALKQVKLTHGGPELVKGVRGTSNQAHIPELISKGILRAKNKIYVNKDGTIRYDMTEATLTAFRPDEIGTSVAKLRELGYSQDIYGKELVSEEQVIELMVQDIVLPKCKNSDEEGANKVLLRVSNFVDDELEYIYGLKRYYNIEKEEDLVGHLVLAMSPHTSAGATARIIGFSETQGFYAHPMLHSLMRRDCDGDEAGVILLMDALINFSPNYLPSHRGAVQDAPLVLTYKLLPREVDDMVFNMDVAFKYPLELYEAGLEYKKPWEVKIPIVEDYLDDPANKGYFGYGFTHDTSDISKGVVYSSYKEIPVMSEKVVRQMELAEKLRAVDENDVARLLIERHFIRDIKGNLRKFSLQQFRCKKCNAKYRRPALNGKCVCGGDVIFTIAEGSIVKYLEPSIELTKKYSLSPYLKQAVELVKQRIESVFGKDKEKQEELSKWF